MLASPPFYFGFLLFFAKRILLFLSKFTKWTTGDTQSCLNNKIGQGGTILSISLTGFTASFTGSNFCCLAPQVSGINPKLNYWDAPLCLSKDKCVGPLPAVHFASITVPFSITGDTVCNPCPLPPDYAQVSESLAKICPQTKNFLTAWTGEGGRF